MRLHSAFVIFLVMAFLLAGISQPSSIDLKDYKKAEQLYNLDNPTEATDRLALQLYQQITNKLSSNPHYDSIVFDAYLKTGILQQMSNQQRESISAFGQAEDKARTSGLADSLLFKPYLFIGTAYYTLNNFDSASYYFERAEAIVLKYPRISDKERLYNKSGTLYYETGNYIQSKYYFEKALTSLDTTDIRNRYLYVNYKNNIASALRKLKQPAEALAIYQSLLSLGIEKDALLQNIGDTYQDMGDFRKAERYLHQSSFTNEKKFNDLGFVYLQLEAFDSSAMYLNRALAMTRDLKQKSIARGTTFSYLGHLYLAQRKPAYALNYYQQALVQLDPDFNDQGLAANPADFEGIHSFSNLFETLTGKANAFYMLFNDSNNADHLALSLSTLQSAFRLASRAAENYESDDARLFLTEKLQAAYQTFVERSLQMFELTKDEKWLRESLSKAENSKAAVLQASLQQLPLTAIRRIPKYLVNEEKNLKASITRLDVLLSSDNDSEQTAATQRSLVDEHIKLSRVHQELEKQPAYRELYKSNSIDLANIQKNILTENEAVVSYYFTTSALIVFFVATDTICYRPVAEMSNVKNAIRNFRSYMDGEAVERSQIEKTEKLLYDKLIAPVQPFLLSKKKLIIIPHNELAYLPFEMMADSSGHHVLDDFSTSYNYSIAFLQPSTTSKKNKKVVAFAPYARQETFSNGLPAIPASAEEVGSLNGNIFIDSAATKQRFVEESATAGIAHLATHASASDSSPIQSYIAFYPAAASDTSFRLYEPEIYNLDLRSSSLVVLSACETGKGKLVHGEGILSLSRAFSYAGCPSIITSLWKADDKATAYICKHLYGYLRKGFSIDVALQKAKRDYLHDKDIPSQFKLPRYWAHLVLVGDTTPLYQSSKNMYLLAVAIFIILLCGIAYWRQKKTRPPGRP